MRKVLSFLVCSLLVSVTVLACGGADVGESCDHEGKTDDCADDGVCGKNLSGSLVCMKQCSAFSDCSGNEECATLGYSSLKGCRAR
ncbi:MAG: hypothetical protein JWP97_5858 [Labilithrix sp.]|nr:hypothetical protein [Labilithrix sp.]